MVFFLGMRIICYSKTFELLQNAVALVTGGASGLGRATVERLAREGTKVVLCDINQEQGEQVAKSEGNITYVQTDVTSEADVRNALNVAKNSYGGLDIVVNCAGVAFGGLVFASHSRVSHTLEDFTKVLTVSNWRFLRQPCKIIQKICFFFLGKYDWYIQCYATGM